MVFKFGEKGWDIGVQGLQKNHPLHHIQTPFAQFVFAHVRGRYADTLGVLGLWIAGYYPEFDQCPEDTAMAGSLHLAVPHS